MGCRIVFNGTRYTEESFREFVKSNQHLDALAHKEVHASVQARFETLGVAPSIIKQYRPIAVNKASRVLTELNKALVEGREKNKDLILDILKVNGLITKNKFQDKYWVKSEIPTSDILSTNKRTTQAQINQPQYFVNKSTLEFLKEAYPNLLSIHTTNSGKGAYINIKEDFTPNTVLQADKQTTDYDLAVDEEVEDFEDTGTGMASVRYPSRYKESSKKIQSDLKIRIKRLQELLAKGIGNKFIHLAKIAELEEDLDRIKSAESDLVPLLYEQANRDILNAEKLVQSNKTLNLNELNELYLSLGIWQNLADTLGEIHLDEDLQKIVNDATKLRKILVRTAKGIFIDQSRGKDNLSLDDMDIMKDDSSLKSWSIDMLSSVNKFIQHIAKFINRAALQRDDEIKEITKKLGDLSKGLSQDEIAMLYQRDKDGKILYNSLVNRLSDKWWDTLKYMSSQSRKASKADELDQSGVASGLSDLDEVKKIKQQVKEFLNKNMATLNPAIFHTKEDGSYILTDQERESIIKDFADKIGDMDYARELVQKGESKFKRFIEESNAYEEYLETIHMDLPEHEKNMFIAEAMREYRGKHDPTVYYNYYYSPGDRQDLHNIYGRHINPSYNKYVVTSPRRTVDGQPTEWYDSQFDNVKANPKLYELYNYVNEVTKEMKRYLPSYALRDDQSNYIYRARSSAAEVLRTEGYLAFLKKAGGSITSLIGQEYDEDYVAHTDPDTGKPIRSVPVSLLNNIDKEIDKLENTLENAHLLNLSDKELQLMRDRLNKLKNSYSKDLISSMEVFVTMASNYKWMSSVHDKALLARAIVDKAKEMSNQGPKEGLTNTKQALDYNIDAMLYGRFKDVEGQSKKGEKWKDTLFNALDVIPLYRSESRKKADELGDRLREEEGPVQELLDRLEDGEILTDDEHDRIKEFYQTEQEYKALGGKRFTLSSVIDTLIKFTGLKALGFAPMSSISNLTFGVVSNYVHAAGRDDFSEKEISQAMSIMLNSTKKYLTFGKSETTISNKISNIMDKLNVITEIIDAKYGQLNRKSKLKVDPYAWFKSTDFFIKGMTTVAKLIHTKVPSSTDGETISLWEAFNENGEINPNLVSEEFYNDWTNNEGKIEFSQQLIKVNKIIHGNADNNSPVMGKKKALGRLISQFRLSWMAEGVEARFAAKYYNSTLGRDLEGRYVTFYHLAQDFSKAWAESGGVITGFKKAIDIMKQRELTPLEKSNFRKTCADMILLVSIMAMCTLVRSMFDDDDDNKIDSKSGSWVFNMLYRLEQDTIFYTSPEVFTTFTSQVVPAMSVYKDFKRAIGSTYDYMNGNEDATPLKNWSKAFPITRQIYNMKMYTEKDISQLQIR